jgi:hypothetical protein
MPRDVSALVKIVGVGDELNAVESAVGQFLAGWRQRLTGIAVRQPGLGRRQAQKVLKATRELDEHLRVELLALVSESHTNPQGPEQEGSCLPELYQDFSSHFRRLHLEKQASSLRKSLPRFALFEGI